MIKSRERKLPGGFVSGHQSHSCVLHLLPSQSLGLLTPLPGVGPMSAHRDATLENKAWGAWPCFAVPCSRTAIHPCALRQGGVGAHPLLQVGKGGCAQDLSASVARFQSNTQYWSLNLDLRPGFQGFRSKMLRQMQLSPRLLKMMSTSP